MERIFPYLIRAFIGGFPVWARPGAGDRSADYGPSCGVCSQSVMLAWKQTGLRAHLDNRNEKVNLKIREAQLQKVPFMLVIGDQ